MSKEVIVKVEPAPIWDMDRAAIGEALVRLVGVSAQFGHSMIQHTLVYGAPEMEPPGARFVRDILTLTTDEITDKWFGGRLNAARYTNAVVSALLFGDDDSADPAA